jgi:hypothetical protein
MSFVIAAPDMAAAALTVAPVWQVAAAASAATPG